MGFPRKIRVGSFVYKVLRARAPDLGHTDTDILHINVSPDCDPLVAASTLLHECLHAVVDETGLKARWGEDEESYVSTLEGGLFGLLRDNPTLVATICDAI